MDTEKEPTKATLPLKQAEVDEDALKLAEMGYSQDLRRNFSVWSVLGVGFSLTNSWFGISAALITGINSGGPLLIIYGIILIFLVSICVGISLSELASALPNAGGQYFWANELAPRRYANFASYLTGWFAWAGAIFTSASVALAVGSALVGCWQLTHPELVVHRWHVFLAYQATNAFGLLFNLHGRFLPTISKLTLYISLLSLLTLIILIPSRAPSPHQSAKFVFATFINNTGWSQSGLAFILGLVNTNWAFACLDCAVHLAEEVHRPEKMVPKAIMGTVGIGFVTSWAFGIAMFFSIQGDFNGIAETATGVPILELFYRALRSKGGAIAAEGLVMATGVGCLVASHTWQCRLLWSFARDGGVPGWRWLGRVGWRTGEKGGTEAAVPVRAHLVSCIVVAVVGCLYLASATAFNSMVTACITLLYLSYSIPVTFLLIRGRGYITHGPFWLGKFGLFCNIVLLAWTIFTIIMYSFPYQKPVQPDNMNYVSVVYAVVVLIVAIDWIVRGRRSYRGVDERHEAVRGS